MSGTVFRIVASGVISNSPHRLAITAFNHVLSRRQSRYRDVLAWLDTRANGIERKDSKLIDQMRKMLRANIPQVDSL